MFLQKVTKKVVILKIVLVHILVLAILILFLSYYFFLAKNIQNKIDKPAKDNNILENKINNYKAIEPEFNPELQKITNNSKVINASNLSIPVLMYHRINNLIGVGKKDIIQVGLRVSTKVFDAQMQFLKRNNYNTISSQDIVNYQYKNIALPSKPILLTFDDGYLDNYTNALPILVKYNLKGEFAIIVDLVGQDSYMNWDQITDLKFKGMSFASHTFKHCYLAGIDPINTKKNGFRSYLLTPKNQVKESSNCPTVNYSGVLNENQVRGELKLSKQKLEEKLSQEVISLVYPFGNYNQTVIEIAKEEGYYYAFTVEGQNKERILDFKNNYELPRTRIFGQQELPINGFFGKI